jgi:hypothetical protein
MQENSNYQPSLRAAESGAAIQNPGVWHGWIAALLLVARNDCGEKS